LGRLSEWQISENCKSCRLILVSSMDRHKSFCSIVLLVQYSYGKPIVVRYMGWVSYLVEWAGLG